MTIRRILFAVLAAVSVTVGIYGQGAGAANPQAPSAGAAGNLATGAWGHAALKPDARGWGWMTKSYVSPSTPRPFYNLAKEKLFQDKQVTSFTISAFDPPFYCEVRKHYDYIWFEMQHSTMSFDEVKRMMQACPGIAGAAPMIRMPDALEANLQKAGDLGVLGIIVPTVDDALEARDAARFSRYPPFGRRSCCAAVANTLWPNVPGGYRPTINDNFLVVAMLETLEAITNADEIANVFGLDVMIQGNNDLSQFSGWNQSDERYQNLLTISHNAALRAGKYWGNAGQGYLKGNPLSPATRFVQNGPAHDGWTPPARGRGPSQEAELPFGVPGAEGPARGGRRGGGAGQ